MRIPSGETARASLFFLVVTAIGLPAWVVVLFPGRIEEHLLSPVTWGLVVLAWLFLTGGLLVGKRLDGR